MSAAPAFPGTIPENLLVELADGTTIAVSLVTPAGPGPFPALLSFYPYRKDDFMGAGVAHARDFFAEAGYATVLVDIRGYGSSLGRSYQAWDQREFDDAAEVVEWAARQPWCNGRTGVWGSSYGGAQALGVATRRPPSLRAIASVYGAADIFEDFVYPGGCPNALGAAAWGALVVAKELAPPSLQDSGGRWLDVWRERLARLDDREISSMIWPAHATYDEYWQSRRIAVESIEVPSFFLSGWRDLLCKGMFDAYDRCQAEKRLLVGPWTHAAPDASLEAPFDWLEELRGWFDRWMTDRPVEVDQPPVIYYVQGAAEWRTADQWPPKAATELVRHPGPDGSLAAAQPPLSETYASPSLVGVEAGLWYPMGLTLAGSFDQGRDDEKSMCFTSEALADAVDITGSPSARLVVQVAGGKEAHLCIKLCHVGPDDRSTLITSGWLRLPPSPGGEAPVRTVDIPFYPTAYRIPAGHRLRWTVSGADFPRLWPTAEAPTFTLFSSDGAPSFITVPVSDPKAGEATVFKPHKPPAISAPWMISAAPVCRITRDEARKGVEVLAGVDMTLRLPQGGTFRLDHSIRGQMEDSLPAAASMRTRAIVEMRLTSGEHIVMETAGYSTLGRRHISGKITAMGEVIYERRWSTFNGT